MPTFNEYGYFTHSHSLVETREVGAGTTIWAFVHVLPGARIGAGCNVCDHCFVEGGVVVGDNVTIKCGVYLWQGTTLEDNVFVGPNVVFTNDMHPRSKNVGYRLQPVLVREGASLGANSTILAGTTIGRYALVGIGAVVTRDVPDYALVYGNPARQQGWVDETGERLLPAGEARWQSADGQQYYRHTAAGLVPESLNAPAAHD